MKVMINLHEGNIPISTCFIIRSYFFYHPPHNNYDLQLFIFKVHIMNFKNSIVYTFFNMVLDSNLPYFDTILLESYYFLISNYLVLPIYAPPLSLNLVIFFSFVLFHPPYYGYLLKYQRVSIKLSSILFVKNFNYHLIHN